MKVYCGIIVSIVFLLCACQNSKRQSFSNVHSSTTVTAGWENQVGGGAYQVSAEEYKDNFESRYGLLHLKSENVPFTGRILMVDIGESGEYVSSDESWVDGRKDGKSSKWFSNGVKMYERNYKRGKWHGTVTRWWPNGQKMYVRAYSYGARHGKEATWRSDGTPITLPEGGISRTQPKTSSNADWSSSVDTSPAETESENFDQLSSNTDDLGSFPSENPILPGLGENSNEDGLGSLDDNNDDLGSLPEIQEAELEPSTLSLEPSALPELTEETSLNELPQLSNDESLPPLPSEDAPLESDLPPLLPSADPVSEFPSLPGGDTAEELPPLPDSVDGTGFDDLPPLPPLP